ncbi:PhoU domain-containing protein [Candidatus Mycoplasma haematominutum]|uniref:Phosphate transport system regulatory protein n=1 Tax=Candidatus Mycoplasma haematominutum 'Birmingham 1' TaxID=1116213 RepID=G8C2M2_9MOLU|nr:PhoU domain-containing protein [Candidatus Mycoplasma haematominutum]CCE66570.1 phosphate transport system regulatory protein [Candidatus Mycoplasma haematominutum 'Birmingham 1']
MAVNSQLLEYSIQKCYSDFLGYLHLIKNFVKSSLLFWEGKLTWEEIFQIEEKSNSCYCKALLDIEWHCSKNTPSANDLRFFLALILSAKDLERCGDYLHSISKIVKSDKNRELKKIILGSELWEIILKYFQTIYSLFRDSIGRIRQLAYQELLAEKMTLHSKLSTLSRQLHQELLNNKGLPLLTELSKSSDPVLLQLADVEKLLSLSRMIQLLLVKVDRFLDHSFNVVENFYYIKNQEFKLDYHSLSRESHLTE